MVRPNSSTKKKISSAASTTNPKKKWIWSSGSRVVSTAAANNNVRIQNIDLYKTQVDGIFIAICSKSWAPGEASFLFPMEKELNDMVNGENVVKEWEHVIGFFPRRDIIVNDGITAKKSAPKGSKWDWKVVAVCVNDMSSIDKVGRHIASCFSKHSKENSSGEGHDKYVYRHCDSTDPKPLNHYLLDMDVTKILRHLVGGDDKMKHVTKEDVMQHEELLQVFYGDSEYGRGYLETMDVDTWDEV